jgi:hypothetical protein
LALFVLADAPAKARTLTPVTYEVSLECADNSWVSYELGEEPGNTIYCDPSVNPTDWCTVFNDPCYGARLFLTDLDGGDLEDGDQIRVRGFNGFGYHTFSIAGTDGEPLSGIENIGVGDDDAIFVIETVDCDYCSVAEGGRISLTSYTSGKFWCAEWGGSDVVNVNRDERGAWEIFTLHVYGTS